MSPFVWLLVVVAVALGGAVAVRRWRRVLPPLAPPSGQDPDDLTSLGLSEARPASARSTPSPAATAAASLPADEARPASSRLAVEASAAEAPGRSDEVGLALGDVRLSHDAPWNGRAVPLLLESLSAHTRAPVAVVRPDGDACHVVARTDGGPLSHIQAALRLTGPRDLTSGRLAALVGGRARAVPLGSHVVLVGGSGAQADHYLSLLAALTPGASLASGEPPDDSADAAHVGRAEAVVPVPRAVLIGQEQAEARETGRPLAFALVTLADAEELLGRDTPEEVAVAESALRLRLESADGVRRVEPFGDLLFGAFLDLDPEGTAEWCDVLAAGDPPLFIGAVAPAKGEPEAVRDAAAEALRDAYVRSGARIVAA